MCAYMRVDVHLCMCVVRVCARESVNMFICVVRVLASVRFMCVYVIVSMFICMIVCDMYHKPMCILNRRV